MTISYNWIFISDETSVALRAISSVLSLGGKVGKILENATQVFLSAQQGLRPHDNKIPVNFVLVGSAQNICWMWSTCSC